ncbi:hypothetical protein GCM10010378_68840 [Streptomyces viridochromogenes]
MLLGIVCAWGAAVCFGAATVLQAMAARTARAQGGGGGSQGSTLHRASSVPAHAWSGGVP